ncbi:MAG: hypothetical protein J7K12_02435 [Thermoplasmata archaeon]|nr:hypothetical protein [Thermoplasmata archaeon]
MLYQMEREGRKLLLHLIERHDGKKMLEVGCGSDELAKSISKNLGRVLNASIHMAMEKML